MNIYRGFFLLIFSLPGLVWSQSPEQFSNNAAAFVTRGSSPVTVVRESATKDLWVKVSARIDKATWDVKKTDSLLQPVVAIVKVDLQTGVSKRSPTKELAEGSELTPADVDVEAVELQFLPLGNGWAFSKGQHFNKALRQWFEIKQSAAKASFNGYGWLIQGFTVATP
jgi:hypothetical protein